VRVGVGLLLSSDDDDVPESDHDFPMKLRRMTKESRENL